MYDSTEYQFDLRSDPTTTCGLVVINGILRRYGIHSVSIDSIKDAANDSNPILWNPVDGILGFSAMETLATLYRITLKRLIAITSIEAYDLVNNEKALLIIGTVPHYYLAQPQNNNIYLPFANLFLGNTGRARRGGSELMSLANIIQNDGPTIVWQVTDCTYLTSFFDTLWKQTELLAKRGRKTAAINLQSDIAHIKNLIGIK